jgi:hypothetical protein
MRNYNRAPRFAPSYFEHVEGKPQIPVDKDVIEFPRELLHTTSSEIVVEESGDEDMSPSMRLIYDAMMATYKGDIDGKR